MFARSDDVEMGRRRPRFNAPPLDAGPANRHIPRDAFPAEDAFMTETPADPDLDLHPAEAEAQRRLALPPAAQRALAEAEARRAAGEAERVRPGDLPPELNARRPAEPVRYGDWEKNGIASDF